MIVNADRAGQVSPSWFSPDWSLPPNIRAAVTTRQGGASLGPFASFNLATHVGDDPEAVVANRQRLRESLGLSREPLWLHQVHGTGVVEWPAGDAVPEADASVCRQPGLACTILTADCLPVLFCDDAGTVVAAAHAGWRGLLNGVLENTVAALRCPPSRVRAWMGPAIGPGAFEVGSEVRAAFTRHAADAAEAFVPSVQAERFMADLYVLARQRLQAVGVEHVAGGGACTYTQVERYYSFRREARCGRMASLIWLQEA